MTTRARAKPEVPETDAAATPDQPEVPGVPEEQPDDAASLSVWEFIDRVPTMPEVVELLATLPVVADYVQGLPSSKETTIRNADGAKVKQRHDVFTLYMSVAGRIKMCEAAAVINGWKVDFEPEPTTPTGVPGFLEAGERIVYREYVVVKQVYGWGKGPLVGDTEGRFPLPVPVPLGRKPGTAWVPRTGGSAASGSNPYEKVETSARGRALAAWGFGVLPGSGVASLEEMRGIDENRLGIQTESRGQQQQGPGRPTRGDLLQAVLTSQEELRQIRGFDEFSMKEKTAQFLTTKLGIDSKVWNLDTGEIDWSLVKDGQLQLMLNSLKESLVQAKASAADV
jgi:hypothetical protein